MLRWRLTLAPSLAPPLALLTQVALLSIADHVPLETPFALTCLVTNTSSKVSARGRGRVGVGPLPPTPTPYP